jgi:predicted ATPase
LICSIEPLPVLLVVTFRPEFHPTWVGQADVTLLPVGRLDRRDSVGIVNGVARGKALPHAVVEQVLVQTDGVPLFIEELTSTLLEGGLLRETTERYLLDGPMRPLGIPISLQAALAARLDRVALGKDVAVLGAAIGREFTHELLAAVSTFDSEDLDAGLARISHTTFAQLNDVTQLFFWRLMGERYRGVLRRGLFGFIWG